MSFKNILVHIDDVGENGAHIETALQLAKQHDAHLTGVYVLSRPYIPAYVQSQIGADVIEMQIRQAREEAEIAVAKFSEQASSEGLSVEGVIEEGLAEHILIDHARCADILVISQNDPDKSQFNGDESLPDRLILAIGRPVLIVPFAGRYPVIGKNVYIAWDGSRQSTRAVNDALPILKMADKVRVLSINQKNKGLGDVPGAGICLHLARHGIKAEADHVVSDEISGADMLLSRAADGGADLIVMGAYGHARWREVVLGGFTEHMLGHMTVPVLMAN